MNRDSWNRIRKCFKTLLDDDTFIGKAFDIFIQVLIFLSMVSFSIETLPHLPGWANTALHYFEWFVVTVFTIEYMMRIAVGGLSYIFSWWGMIDLLAILPTLIGAEVDLRSVRILRVLRFIRALKLTRYIKAMHRLNVAFGLIRDELVMYLLITILVLYLSSVGIYYFEHDAQPQHFASVLHAFWWSVVTLTTVGYGDVYPVTPGGKFFTFIVLMLGLGIISVPTGLITSALQEAKKLIEQEQESQQEK